MVRSYRDLLVWRKSMALVGECYRITREGYPVDERYGLVSQIRRAAVSIPANVAEGNGRGHRRDYVRFLWIANGSLMELETEIYVSELLGYVSPETTTRMISLTSEIGRMLGGLIRSLCRPAICTNR